MTNTETTVKKSVIEEMFNAGAHFGYSKSKRHPSMKPLIFGVKNSVEIINLEKTDEYLSRAKDFVASLAKEGKQILFVGSKNEARDVVKNAAMSADLPYVTNRWIGGTITNFSEIKKRIARLEELTSKKEKGELGMYTKKERLLIDREIEGLEKHFGGLISMKQKPSALFVIDSGYESIAVKEAKDSGVPIVSLSGSDCNIKYIDYPIPANDSSRSSISFFVDVITNTYKTNFQTPVATPKASMEKDLAKKE